jgi:hypothetical protein
MGGLCFKEENSTKNNREVREVKAASKGNEKLPCEDEIKDIR